MAKKHFNTLEEKWKAQIADAEAQYQVGAAEVDGQKMDFATGLIAEANQGLNAIYGTPQGTSYNADGTIKAPAPDAASSAGTGEQTAPTGDIEATKQAGLDTLEGGVDTAAPAAPRERKERAGYDPSLGDQLAGLSTGTGGLAGGSFGRGSVPRAAPLRTLDTSGVDPASLSAAATGQTPAPSSQAPTVNRENVDRILGGLNTYGNQIAALAGDNTGLSAAEAALTKASREADIRSGIATEASQRGALGTARSMRNRGDRALGERQAIGEQAFIGQEAARNDALRQAEQEGQLAQLRANEETADKTFKLDALSKAADLGFNTAALEVDISKTDLQSAMNQINNEFQKNTVKMQIDAHKAEAILNFTRDMAAIQFEYDKLGVDDQNTADALLMQKYGIDQQTLMALKELKQKSQVNWGQVLTSFAGGAGSGLTAAIASDARVKRDFGDPGDQDIADLFGALDAQTYEYKNPEKHGQGLQFGFMAQALESTRLGKAMVTPDPEGVKRVDTGRVAMATAAGLSHVLERLSALESAVN